jgi:hypothetical protein
LGWFCRSALVGSDLFTELHLLLKREVVRDVDDPFDGGLVLPAVGAGPEGTSTIGLTKIERSSARHEWPEG